MTEVSATHAGVGVFLDRFSPWFRPEPSDVARPIGWQADSFESSVATAPAPSRITPGNPGIWSRVRSFLGLEPTPPAVTAAPPQPGVWSRIRTFLFGPARPSQPLSRAAPAASVPFTGTLPSARNLTPSELKRLGATDKQAFFRALLPAAIAAERQYGVPASVTLAQAALESGWARSPIGGYNIFGIKGSGPAGSKTVWTHEYFHGVRVPWRDKFALYHNFEEAIMAHGRLFTGGRHKGYTKGVTEFAQNHDPYRFIDNVGRTYATSPHYARDIKAMMTRFHLVEMARSQGGT